MKKTFHLSAKYAAIIMAVCLVFTSFVSHASYADTQDDYNNNNKQLEELKNTQNSLSEEYKKYNDALSEAGSKLNNIEASIAEKQQEISALEQDINNLENEKNDQYAAMKLRIRFMYEHDNANVLSTLLESKDLSELLVRAEYYQKIADYDRNMLKNLNELIVTQNNYKTKLTDDYNSLLSLKDEAQKESDELKNLVESFNEQLNTNADKIAEAEAKSLEYEQKLEQERIEKMREEMNNNSGGSSGSSGSGNNSGNNSGNTNSGGNSIHIDYDNTDLLMLAAIIECEAGNQPYEGKLAVGSVVLNRVADPRFADTIAGVLYSPYQFSPVASGRFAIVLARGASKSCMQAAAEVLNGHINISALYFHAYDSSKDFGGTVIGDHVFY